MHCRLLYRLAYLCQGLKSIVSKLRTVCNLQSPSTHSYRHIVCFMFGSTNSFQCFNMAALQEQHPNFQKVNGNCVWSSCHQSLVHHHKHALVNRNFLSEARPDIASIYVDFLPPVVSKIMI